MNTASHHRFLILAAAAGLTACQLISGLDEIQETSGGGGTGATGGGSAGGATAGGGGNGAEGGAGGMQAECAAPLPSACDDADEMKCHGACEDRMGRDTCVLACPGGHPICEMGPTGMEKDLVCFNIMDDTVITDCAYQCTEPPAGGGGAGGGGAVDCETETFPMGYCAGRKIICPESDTICDVDCDGQDACKCTTIECGRDGPCNVHCKPGACDASTRVNCRNGKCHVDCPPEESPTITKSGPPCMDDFTNCTPP